MGLIKSNTKWVLFLSAKQDAEHRHILDLAFGLHCLESAGISQADIFIYIDGNDRNYVAQWMGNGSNNSYTIKQSNDFFTDQANNAHENMVMFVTGHGSILGIDAQTAITPHALLKSIKNTPNLKHAILYLGQCYAGVFNYIGAGKKISTAVKEEPDLIIIGATNLHESLSSSTTETLANGAMTWIANLFLLHIFKWLSNRIDVDGDGKTTVMDSYKYAGAMSNGANKIVKIQTFVQSFELHDKWNSAKKVHENSPNPGSLLLYQALTSQYENLLGVRYTHQECWILNAIPAQSIEY